MVDRDSNVARLCLEDGTIFDGRSVGAPGERLGEVVFNTAMTGYEEVITDPSYKGQIVAMTAPMMGNYGICEDRMESDGPKVSGFILGECCALPSHYSSEQSLPAYLRKHGTVAADGIDTRALTRHLRAHGTLKAVLST